MLDYNRFELSFCIGSLDGRCLRRAARLGLAMEAIVSSSHSKAAEVADLIGQGHDLACLVAQGLHCPHAPHKPSFKYPVLQVGDEEVRRFRRRCRQTELLELFEIRGWPNLISNPFGAPSTLDPENGISDVLYELNQHQLSRLQIHFSCVGGDVQWEILGLARLFAPRSRNGCLAAN